MLPRLLLFLQAARGPGGDFAPGTSMNYTTLFNRIGAGLSLLNTVNEFRGAAGTALATDMVAKWGTYVAYYDGEDPAIRSAVFDASTQLDSWISSLAGPPNWIGTSLSTTIIEMTNEQSRLSSKRISVAIAALIETMLNDGKTVNANAVSASLTAAGGNIGDGNLVVSLVEGDGSTLEYVYDEEIALAFTSTTTAGSERAQLLGTLAASGYLAQDWPLGSACKASLTSVAAGGGSNLLGNGGFETFTVANTPDDWTIDVGAAGADILDDSSHVLVGGHSLAIVGDGSTLTQLSQPISGLSSWTPYAVNLWLKASATPAAGALVIDLFDGSAVINDQAGTPNTLTIDLTALSTAWTPFSAAFRLREPVPASVSLRLRLSTALTTAHSVYVDELALLPMTQLYTAGPYAALFSGATAWCLTDTWTITISNDYGGKIQTGFWRAFDMPNLGLILASKSDGTENISDSFVA